MTDSGSFQVATQWALQGKTLGRSGYRVLACSTGGRDALNLDNFTEAIGRFTMGTPETLPNALPQVTVSYLQPGRVNHLALAIHRPASDPRFGGQLTVSDDDGRPVVATSYYCVPYGPLSGRSVSYRDMYEAFAPAPPLRPENGDVLSVAMPAAPAAPDPATIDPLAAQAAALLLMGRPVCVLGATLQTSMTDRLGFIDTVMSLLPYGFRARMTAATWTRATNQSHRFRLFFSGARRDASTPDNAVVWGHPEQTISAMNNDAEWYLECLVGAGQVTQEKLSLLTGITKPLSLGNETDVKEALDFLFRRWRPRFPRLGSLLGNQEPALKDAQSAPGQPADVPAADLSEVERLFIDCDQAMKAADSQQLGDCLGGLKKLVKRGVGAAERDHCQKLIRGLRLFRHDDALGKDEGTLRELLLRIAFEPPISYADYCLIEAASGTGEEEDLDPPLLRLIGKLETADDRVKAITYKQLPAAEAGKKLSEWYKSGELTAYYLVNLLAREVQHPRHTRLLSEVTADYLGKKRTSYDPKLFGAVLRQHSYLAGKLEDSKSRDAGYQLNTLGTFLRAAYPEDLTQRDLKNILTGTPESVTFPLFWTVLLMVGNADDARLAMKLFLDYSVELADLETSIHDELVKRIDAVLVTPAGAVTPAGDPRPKPSSRLAIESAPVSESQATPDSRQAPGTEAAPGPQAALDSQQDALPVAGEGRAPLPTHDDLLGDPTRQLPAGGQGTMIDCRPDWADRPPRPEGGGW